MILIKIAYNIKNRSKNYIKNKLHPHISLRPFFSQLSGVLKQLFYLLVIINGLCNCFSFLWFFRLLINMNLRIKRLEWITVNLISSKQFSILFVGCNGIISYKFNFLTMERIYWFLFGSLFFSRCWFYHWWRIWIL